MWFERRLDTITLSDLEGLVRERVRENRSLDYKDEQPAAAQATNDKKSEFAVDVSALANGVGGLLVYGSQRNARTINPPASHRRSTDYVDSSSMQRRRGCAPTWRLRSIRGCLPDFSSSMAFSEARRGQSCWCA